MKKFISAAAALLLSASCMFAQNVAKGDLIGDVGIGVGARDGGGSTAAFTQRIALECGIAQFDMLNADWTLTLGGQISNGAYAKHHYVSDDLTFMPQVSLHHDFADRLDGYATLGLGFGLLNSKIDLPHASDKATTASFAMAFNIGARYWLSSTLAVGAQFGLVSATWKNSYGSYNILSAGISYKF